MTIITRSGNWVTVSFPADVEPDFTVPETENEELTSLESAPSVTINDSMGENHPVSFEQLAVIYIQDDEKTFDLADQLLESGQAKVVGAGNRGVIECYLANRHLLKTQMAVYEPVPGD